RSTFPPPASSRASINSAITNSKKANNPTAHPTGSQSVQPATTSSRSGQSCDSSTTSASTPSTPAQSRTASPSSPTAHRSRLPTPQNSSPSASPVDDEPNRRAMEHLRSPASAADGNQSHIGKP